MIATRNNLPLLQDHYGGICTIETAWLLASLERAAIKAGFLEWWLADHVTSSVCSYLGHFYTKNVVGLGRLQEVVKRALQDIGYGEIAHCFEAESPACHISLLQCAQNIVPVGVETFYKALAGRIEDLHQSRLPSFHFYELRLCLLYLNGSESVEAALQTEDVVAFIRDKISSVAWDREVNCSIS